MERYHIYKLGIAILFYAIYCRRPMVVNGLDQDHIVAPIDQQISTSTDNYVYYQGVQGKPGVDFPIFSHIPRTTFSCRTVESGYYADLETDCQVFHICNEGVKVSFLCPNGTIFQQSDLICDWWFKVNCTNSPSLYEESAEQLRDANIRRKASRRVNNRGGTNFAERKMDVVADYGYQKHKFAYQESEETQVPQETASFFNNKGGFNRLDKNPYPNHRETYSEIKGVKNLYTNGPNLKSSSVSPQTSVASNRNALNHGQPFVVSTPKFGTYSTERSSFKYSPTVPTITTRLTTKSNNYYTTPSTYNVHTPTAFQFQKYPTDPPSTRRGRVYETTKSPTTTSSLPKTYSNIIETFTNPPSVANGVSTTPRKIKSKTSFTIGLNSVQGAVPIKTTPSTQNIKINLSSDQGSKAIHGRTGNARSYESNSRSYEGNGRSYEYRGKSFNENNARISLSLSNGESKELKVDSGNKFGEGVKVDGRFGQNLKPPATKISSVSFSSFDTAIPSNKYDANFNLNTQAPDISPVQNYNFPSENTPIYSTPNPPSEELKVPYNNLPSSNYNTHPDETFKTTFHDIPSTQNTPTTSFENQTSENLKIPYNNLQSNNVNQQETFTTSPPQNSPTESAHSAVDLTVSYNNLPSNNVNSEVNREGFNNLQAQNGVTESSSSDQNLGVDSKVPYGNPSSDNVNLSVEGFKVSLENEVPKVGVTANPTVGFYVTKEDFRPANGVTSSFNAGSITGSKNTYIPTSPPISTLEDRFTTNAVGYTETEEYTTTRNVPAGFTTRAPGTTTSFPVYTNTQLTLNSIYTTVPPPTTYTEYHSNTYGFVKPTGKPKPKPFSLPSTESPAPTRTAKELAVSEVPNYHISSASPFGNFPTTTYRPKINTLPTIYTSAKPFSAVPENVHSMLDTLKEIADVKVNGDVKLEGRSNINGMLETLKEISEFKGEGEESRPGLLVPPSAGPQTLHTLAVYFANALDNLVPEENSTEVEEGGKGEDDSVIKSLLSKHTVSGYHELFMEKEEEDGEEEVKGEVVSEEENDLESEHSSNAVQSPRVRQLAKVFTQALSSYLEDPAMFRKVLQEIRPTEPPVIKTLPTEVPEEDELLNFSDADIKASNPRLPTPPPPNPTWGYILAFNKSEIKGNHLDNTLENLLGADSQSFIPGYNGAKPEGLPSNHWTSSPEVTKLWKSALSVNPIAINQKLNANEGSKVVEETEGDGGIKALEETKVPEGDDVKDLNTAEGKGLVYGLEQTTTGLPATSVEASTVNPISHSGANNFASNSFASNSFLLKDFDPRDLPTLNTNTEYYADGESTTQESIVDVTGGLVTESVIDYELRELPKLQLNTTQVHGILIDFMNSTKNDNSKLHRILHKLNTTEDEFLNKMQEIEQNPLTRRLILLLISECGNKTLESKAVDQIIDLGKSESKLAPSGFTKPNSPLGGLVSSDLTKDDQDSRALQLLNSLYSIASKYGK